MVNQVKQELRVRGGMMVVPGLQEYQDNPD